jgi:outer membrane protein, multidrug efflux system
MRRNHLETKLARSLPPPPGGMRDRARFQATRPRRRRPRSAGQAAEGDRSIADLAWWDVYRDPRLKELIRAALANGFDARIAAARVERVARDRRPGPRAAVPRGRLRGEAPTAGRNAVLGNPYTQGGGSAANGFDGYLGAAWELDLWGRVRRLDEAARSQYLATEEARRGVLLSLVATWRRPTTSSSSSTRSWRSPARRRRPSARASSSSTGSSRAASRRGSTPRAPRRRWRQRGADPRPRAQIAIKENQISVLVGRAPGPVARGARPRRPGAARGARGPALGPPRAPPRRPRGRIRGRAANAGHRRHGRRIPAAHRPERHPRRREHAAEQITSRSAGLWSVGAGATGPLFQGGGLRGSTSRPRRLGGGEAQYQQAALNAFATLRMPWSRRQKLAEVRDQQERAVGAYQEAVKLSTQRYGAGRPATSRCIQAQQQLFPAEVRSPRRKRDQFTAVVQLYKALGGGWNLKDAGRFRRRSPSRPPCSTRRTTRSSCSP